jgi:hypothetical protein
MQACLHFEVTDTEYIFLLTKIYLPMKQNFVPSKGKKAGPKAKCQTPQHNILWISREVRQSWVSPFFSSPIRNLLLQWYSLSAHLPAWQQT